MEATQIMGGGISTVIGTVALFGFLLFLAGVGMVIVSASQNRPVRGGIVLAVVGLVAGLLLTVVETINGNLSEARREGTHIIVPVLQQATIYDISRQEYTMASGREESIANRNDDGISARTLDGQEVELDVTVLFSVDPDQVNLIHRNWEKRYLESFVRPTVRNLVRNAVSNYNAEAIYGVSREELEDGAEQSVLNRFALEGLILHDLQIRSISFSDQFIEEIEAKVSAEQRQQRAQTEAETRRIEASGRAQARIEEARGEAEAIVLNAQAQAEALALISQQIAANPSLIQYEYIQRLADNVSLALIPSNSPFLFDFDSFQSRACLVGFNPKFIR
jgi:regulator of protease activity HflC (stomatin/prohibitin superfamily)